ncbi:DMT family transporter [Pseudodonghicola flavimaris]|uniref:DMT family transporter n=1 Tax=Pseudodonghicola flavimaris TaxID=3050036 RepID=A0ABT7EX36_9RHOB|nr:DMT family transporter [Pseudodonghicola flavimaris]MDK3016905.1 DMT family transporter [Pseudodonghicola flavimaris]
MATSLTSHRPALAITLKLSAICLFSIMSALIKATADDVPPGEAVFFRSFFAIPVILVWIAARGELRSGLVAQRPIVHFWRGLIGTSAMGLTFSGLGLLPLPEVTAIGYATPILTLILAAVMLGERIRMIRLSAVAIGLVGVLIMLWPRLGGTTSGQGAATLGAFLILGATSLRALVQIHIRKMVETERTSAIVFYFSATAAGLALLTMPFGWVVPRGETLALLILAGLIGGGAQILVTSSYRFGPASMLAPYEYASMLFAILIGYVWFKEVPTLIMLSGAALVIAGNILVIWREHQLGLERSRARAVSDPKA